MNRLLCAVLVLLLAIAPAAAVEIQRVVSPGGVEAWLVEDHSLPVVAVDIEFRAGAAYEDPAHKGVANMVSALLDEGAGPLDSQAFQRRLEDLATSLRFSASLDYFGGSLRTLTANVEPALELLRLALTEPRFESEPVERIRTQILIGLAHDEQDPGTIASRLWWATAFQGHPYAVPVAGTSESVKALAKEDFVRFMRTRLGRSVLRISVVGDIGPEALKPLLDKTFLALPERPEAAPAGEVAPKTAGETLLVRKPIPQSVVFFGHKGPKRDDPDWYAALIVNYILGGGGFGSRLMEEVREKRGLAYGVYTSLAPLLHSGLWVGNVATENSRVGQSIDIIRSEWRRMREEGPTETELRDAKTFLTGSFPLRLDSTGRIADTLTGIQQEELGIDYLDKRNSYIEAVTLEDARRVARSMLDAEALVFTVIGLPTNLAPTREIAPNGQGG